MGDHVEEPLLFAALPGLELHERLAGRLRRSLEGFQLPVLGLQERLDLVLDGLDAALAVGPQLLDLALLGRLEGVERLVPEHPVLEHVLDRDLGRFQGGQDRGGPDLAAQGLEVLALQHLRDLVHPVAVERSEEHTSELQSLAYLVCRLLLEKKNTNKTTSTKLGMRNLLHYSHLC